MADVRAGLEAGEDFAALLDAGGHRLDFTDVEFVARFITPVGSPRRFDARFFVAPAPHDAEPEHDDGEIVDWDWYRPGDALARYQSGEIDRSGTISKAGDRGLRALLYEAATALMGRSAKRCWLKRWAEKVAKRRGVKRARVALARRLAVVLLAMWKTDTPYRCEPAPAA